MKIENNGISPLTTKPADLNSRVDKKDDRKGVQVASAGQDKAEMSGNARLLSKARVALGNVDDTDTGRIASLKRQIESGSYVIQMNELAGKLVARLNPK
jgi:flagellar biosynthesis anti-sigma factor FlgM